DPVSFEIRVTEPAGATVTPLGLDFEVGPHALLEGRMLVAVPQTELGGRQSVPVRLEVRAGGELIQALTSAFVAPPGGGQGNEGAGAAGGQPGKFDATGEQAWRCCTPRLRRRHSHSRSSGSRTRRRS